MGNVLVRIRPISLEFARQIPDHRCVLDQEDPQSDPQEFDLSDSIDALLDEIDASCAHFEKQPDPEPGSMGLISDDGTKPEAGEPIADDEPESETEAESEAESETEPEAETESIGEDALDALDAVSQSAEALLEESIGELLDESAPEPEAVDDEPAAEAVEDEPSEEVIDSINEDLVSALGDEQIEPVHALDEDEAENETEAAEAVQDPEPTDAVDTGEASTDAIEDATEALAEQPAPQALEEAEPQEAEEPEEKGEESSADLPEADDLLGNLDDALAGIGDELLMGDFEDADGAMIDSDSLEDSIDPAMLLDQLEIPKPIPADDQGDASTEPSSPNQEPSQSDSSSGVQSDPESAHEVRACVRVPDAIKASPSAALETNDALGDNEIESIWQKLWRVGKAQGLVLWALIKAQGGPIAAKGLLAISKPLASKPAQVRDSIGYLAIWTMFLAMVLWVYVMFFRTPPPIVPTHAPTRMVAPGENLEPIENQMAHPLPEQP